MTIDDIRKIVAVACEYRASVHIAFKGGGEIHVNINPADERNGSELDDAEMRRRGMPITSGSGDRPPRPRD